MRLSDLSDGQSAIITRFNELSPDVRKRLMIMGMLPNTRVSLVRRAPMGDPLQVEVRGVSIAVRDAIASLIYVEVVA